MLNERPGNHTWEVEPTESGQNGQGHVVVPQSGQYLSFLVSCARLSRLLERTSMYIVHRIVSHSASNRGA